MQKQNCNASTVSQLASVLYILKSKAISIWGGDKQRKKN